MHYSEVCVRIHIHPWTDRQHCSASEYKLRVWYSGCMAKLKQNLTQIIAIIIFIYSSIVMAGWIFNIDPLTRILPDQINMKFITAFSFLISSVALWSMDLIVRGKREIPHIILPATTMLLLLIMMTLIAGGLFGVQTGISDLFGRGLTVKTVIAGMPSLPVMFAFVLFGVASILALFESPSLKQGLFYIGTVTILIGSIACLGYLFQNPIFYYKFSGQVNPMALNTAILFVFLGLGLVLSGRSQNENKP